MTPGRSELSQLINRETFEHVILRDPRSQPDSGHLGKITKGRENRVNVSGQQKNGLESEVNNANLECQVKGIHRALRKYYYKLKASTM